jgi:hypothetical protein
MTAAFLLLFSRVCQRRAIFPQIFGHTETSGVSLSSACVRLHDPTQ